MSRSTALHPRDYRRPGQEEDAIIIDDDNDDLMQIDVPETTTPAGQFHFQYQQQQQQRHHQHQRMGYGMFTPVSPRMRTCVPQGFSKAKA